MVAADSMCGRIDDAATAETMPMATSYPPNQLERFRRDAKKLSRNLSISHSEALDRIAAQHGFQNWSILAKHSSGAVQPIAPLRPPASPTPRPQATKRYYLHGDVVVDDPTRCYCARCDLFVELSHFGEPGYHRDNQDGVRFLSSLQRHNELPLLRKAARGRPENAPNVLEKQATQERDTREASRSPFHRWLETQRGRNDSVGDLADDILRDHSFPVSLSTRHQLEDRLAGHGNLIVRAIRKAWREFSETSSG